MAETTTADNTIRAPGGTWLRPIHGQRDVRRRLTDADLTHWLSRPHRQDLIVRVVDGEQSDGTVDRVQLEPVEWHAQCGPFWVDAADVDHVGPAEALKVMCPGRWREEYAGCVRVRVPWAVWSERPEAEARLMRELAGPVMRVASADDYDADFGDCDSNGLA